MFEYVPPSPEKLALIAKINEATRVYHEAIMAAAAEPMRVYEEAIAELVPDNRDKVPLITMHRALIPSLNRFLRNLAMRASIAAEREDAPAQTSAAATSAS